MKETIQKSLGFAVIASEGVHIFCCVLPTLFSLLGLLAGLGVIAVLPPAIIAFHDVMHEWEVTIIAASGFVLALGWAAAWYSKRIDCHSSGCAHGACAPQKNRAHTILKFASILFVVNVLIYTTVHRSDWFAKGVGAPLIHSEHGHESHDERHNDL